MTLQVKVKPKPTSTHAFEINWGRDHKINDEVKRAEHSFEINTTVLLEVINWNENVNVKYDVKMLLKYNLISSELFNITQS